MKKQEVVQGLKAAAKYFSAMGGGAAFIVSIVGYAVPVPPVVSIPIIAVVGVASAYVGWRRELLDIREEALRTTAHELDQARVKREQEELLNISRTLDSRMKTIVRAENKIAARLAESVAEQKQMFLQHQADQQQRSVSQPLAPRHLPGLHVVDGRESYSSSPSPTFPSTVKIKIYHSPQFFVNRLPEPATAPAPAVALTEQRSQEVRAHSSGLG